MWDPVNGTYYSHCSADWSYRYGRYVEANALMILAQLKLFAHILLNLIIYGWQN